MPQIQRLSTATMNKVFGLETSLSKIETKPKEMVFGQSQVDSIFAILSKRKKTLAFVAGSIIVIYFLATCEGEDGENKCVNFDSQFVLMIGFAAFLYWYSRI